MGILSPIAFSHAVFYILIVIIGDQGKMVPPKILKGAIRRRWCRPRTTMPCIRDLLFYINADPKPCPLVSAWNLSLQMSCTDL